MLPISAGKGDLVFYKSLDIVIHCAAYTKVDQAESEPGLAYLITVMRQKI